MKVNDIRNYFINELKNGNVVEGRGGKTIEMLGASFIADEPAIFGEPNNEYIDNEIRWYMSQSTNIKDLSPKTNMPPQAWINTADEHGNINSNYGYLIFSEKYYNQHYHVLNELIQNPESRRATMVYTRPSIWVEYDEGGKSDFICTNAVTYYIRDNKMHCVVQMRSNDVVFGYKNDYAWQKFMLNSIVKHYNREIEKYDIEIGDIYWQVQNLHIYSKHFLLVK